MFNRGRKKIYAKTDNITAENVWDVVSDCLQVHVQNVADIQYLYNYYRGDQPVLYREKEIRPEINNKIVINRAYEIVAFKTGYLLSESIQYIRRDRQKDVSEDVKYLNDAMKREGKQTKDTCLAEWMYICGIGYRAVFPKSWIGKNDGKDHSKESPFKIFTLDPREVFVAHSRELGNEPVMAVIKSDPIEYDTDDSTYTVYTKDSVFYIKNGEIIKTSPNTMGEIPVVEYPENNARLGSFEIVLEILNAINESESSRLDDIVQTVQSLLVLIGVDLAVKDENGNDANVFDAVRKYGGIALPDKNTDAKYLNNPLNQGNAETVVKDLEQAWITITGLPNRNGKNSTSDTGSAVYMRDGHAEAEIRASKTEDMWKLAENRFLEIVLGIISNVRTMQLTADDIEAHFNRQNAINIQSKTQSFAEMMATNWVSLSDAFKFSGLAYDVETASENGEKWHELQEDAQLQTLQKQLDAENAYSTADNGDKEDSEKDPVKDDANAESK